jgi:hypothetical protein
MQDRLADYARRKRVRRGLQEVTDRVWYAAKRTTCLK